eukprot:CAMPEP_0170260386 /NCGR_PEP_ID=MMETSP0116_2-20130129/30067_1 /TAXON_ID=400756 /ORGANISM="Durinskia baltica, Strain CSIRO CS-38" /LENGTH=47 /DNA_ID= /DNA_START= /DNA_END= /DNA_ORIENTATION=
MCPHAVHLGDVVSDFNLLVRVLRVPAFDSAARDYAIHLQVQAGTDDV